MKITPNSLSITQLFSYESEQFSIPAYQRRYAWNNKQVLELFEDIDSLDEKDTHFLGTILLLTEPHKAGINVLEVVDGQQRIISLSLLLKVIKEKFIELEEKDTANKIDNYLFCQDISRKRRNKVILGDLDEPDYSKIFASQNLEEVKNQKLLQAYEEFKNHLSEFDFDKLNVFYYKLLNCTTIIRLDTEKADNAYKIFELINNRGLRLSPTDIIKNFLLGHASIVSADVLKEARECWKSLIVSLDGIETDDFFRQYLMGILQRKVTFSKLIYEFKKYYLTTVKESNVLPEYRLFNEFPEYENGEENHSTEDNESGQPITQPETTAKKVTPKLSIIEFADSLKKSADIYGKIINRTFEDRKINHHLYNLQRIESFPTYTFLLNLFQREIGDKEKVTILKLLEAFMLRRHISEYRTSELDDIFPKLTDLKDENIVNQVRDNLADYFPENVAFEKKFAAHSFKGNEDRAKYVLEQFEYNLIEDQGEYIINSGKEVHLEHIIPQTINTKKAIKEYGDWVSYLGKEALSKHGEYIDRIGNYTLLGQKLNIKASNNPFRAKKKEYKKSNIHLTQKLAEEYSTFKFKQVDKRSLDFAKIALKIWNLQ
jgi:uncharacterized protein with ParB-like and HNH nuclease domain